MQLTCNQIRVGVRLVCVRGALFGYKTGINNLLTTYHASISRRRMLAGLFASLQVLRGVATQAKQTEPIAPFELGNGLEVRDYRLFPTEAAMRFIVELHNTTDSAIDTPAVGVTLPNLDARENFSWANPVSMVLHPHSSDCLVGVAPQALTTDKDWGTPRWEVCRAISTKLSKKLPSHELVLNHSIRVINPQEADLYIEVSNPSDAEVEGWVLLQPIIWDNLGRLCGAAPMAGKNGIGSHASVTMVSRIRLAEDSAMLPPALIESLEEISASISFQPGVIQINSQSCDAVLPWND